MTIFSTTKTSLKKAFALCLAMGLSSQAVASELTVYAYKHYKLKGELYKKFEEETGIKVNTVFGGAGKIMKQLEVEGNESPADILLMADVGRLHKAKQKGLLKSIDSEILKEKIPEKYRDPDNTWFGFSKRARVIYYNPEHVNPENISNTYSNLTKPNWKKKILVRPSNNIYNQSFLAAMIAHKGESDAKKWVISMRDNLAKLPAKGSDRDQAIAVANSDGKIAIANHYYMGKMLNNKKQPSQQEAAKKLRMKFVEFENGGTHINLSAAAVLKSSKNNENALKFMEFLFKEYSQALMVKINYEYPIVSGVKLTPLVESWGTLKEDDISTHLLGKFNAEATEIFSQYGW